MLARLKSNRRGKDFSVEGADVAENGRHFPQAEGASLIGDPPPEHQQTSEASGRRNKQYGAYGAFYYRRKRGFYYDEKLFGPSSGLTFRRGRLLRARKVKALTSADGASTFSRLFFDVFWRPVCVTLMSIYVAFVSLFFLLIVTLLLEKDEISRFTRMKM